jgi:WD40 repeat protein
VPPEPAAYSGNIVDLQEQGQIEVRAQGNEIDEVTLELRNLTDDSLDVVIPTGTYLISNDAAMQNMVVRRSQTVRLTDQDWNSVVLQVACANIDRDVPGGETGFEIQRSPVQPELEPLLANMEQENAIFDVQQAAVWIVTDNADLEELGTLVRTSVGNPLGSRAIGYDDAAQAMRFVDEAGINIRRKAIWNDRQEIAQGVEDPLLAEWISEREGQLGPGGEADSDTMTLVVDLPVLGAAFVPDAQQVVTSICISGNSMRSCHTGEKQVWDSVTGELLQSFGYQPAGHDELIFSPDGRLMASAACEEQSDDGQCVNGIVQLWDTESWSVAGVLRDHPDRVEAMAFSPDGGSIASRVCVAREGNLCTASEVWLWDVAAREVTRRYVGFLQFANSLAFSPDGQLLAAPICSVPGGETYCQESEVWVWDVTTGEVVQQLQLETGRGFGTTFTADGEALVAVGAKMEDGAGLITWLWQTDSWELASTVPIDEGELFICTPVAFEPAQEMVAVGQCELDAEGGLIRSSILIWDLRSGAPISRIDTQEEYVAGIDISSDGAQALFHAVPGLGGDRVMLWSIR